MLREASRLLRCLPVGALMHLAIPVRRLPGGSGCSIDRDPIDGLLAAGFEVLAAGMFRIRCPGFRFLPINAVRARRPGAAEKQAGIR